MARRPKTGRTSYTAHFERNAGRWRVHVAGLDGLTATGRTVQEARRRLHRKLRREHPEVPPEAVLERVHLEGETRNALRSFRAARQRVMKEEERLRRTGERVAGELVADMGLWIRDAADLMGVSGSWVQRLLKE